MNVTGESDNRIFRIVSASPVHCFVRQDDTVQFGLVAAHLHAASSMSLQVSSSIRLAFGLVSGKIGKREQSIDLINVSKVA
ncbi:MAG: hypothetical protein OXF88_04690 [Rhodobacteraceae bacterium]|nr:hypothetical protein [Paracoccaceae bacterium]